MANLGVKCVVAHDFSPHLVPMIKACETTPPRRGVTEYDGSDVPVSVVAPHHAAEMYDYALHLSKHKTCLGLPEQSARIMVL
jgi:hypothetical protein